MREREKYRRNNVVKSRAATLITTCEMSKQMLGSGNVRQQL